MSHELAKINPEQFGNLVTLPDVLKQNQSLAVRAKDACKESLERLKAIDLEKVDAEQMESHDQHLNTLQVKLKDSYTLMQDRRKPFTQFMDEVKSMFTACEGEVVQIGKEVKAIRDAWQKEKARRASIAEQQQREQLQKKQEEIELRNYARQCIHSAFYKAIAQTIDKMVAAFNAQTVASFDEYEPKLRKYAPSLDETTFNSFLPQINAKPHVYSFGEAQVIYAQVAAELREGLAKEWSAQLSKERDRLLELIPSRKRELERITQDAAAKAEADARMAREQEERNRQLEQEAADRAAMMEQEAEVQKMNAAFDQAAEATPVVGMAKGTVVKRKYQPKSHKAHVAIIQWWVSNCMPLMTLDELQTKLSFMRTAADKALNEGKEQIVAEGMEVVEDYSTRAARSKKEVA